MNTIDKIEKRRRELQYITYFLIYFLALVVFGLFFFIDHVAGFFEALKYKFIMRTGFVTMIIGVIIYLGWRQKQQSALTKQVIDEMDATSSKLRKELRHNKFLSDISYMVNNLTDNVVMEQLFRMTLAFLRADGGAVVLRNQGRGSSWRPPLATHPEQADEKQIKGIVQFVSKSGRSLLQPHPDFPDHRPIKEAKSVLAVPLRLDNRLYGVILFWANGDTIFDQSDLSVLEIMAREAANSTHSLDLLQERTDQFQGLLRLVADSTETGSKSSKRSTALAEHVRALAKEVKLSNATIDALATATMLRNAARLQNGSAKKNGRGAADVLKSLNFPKAVTDILQGYATLTAAENGERAKAPLSSQVLALSETFVDKAYPKRGRGPAPGAAFKKLRPEIEGRYDDKVVLALEMVVSPVDSKPPTD